MMEPFKYFSHLNSSLVDTNLKISEPSASKSLSKVQLMGINKLIPMSSI